MHHDIIEGNDADVIATYMPLDIGSDENGKQRCQLIRRTLDGDETAFAFLVDKYKGAVHALAYRKIGNFHTAEDISQDTFLKAYQKLHTLKDWRRFPGWLYRIASRLCLMWYRQHRLPTQSLDTVEKRYMDTLAWAKHTDQRTRQAVR